ncbi:MAG TPA: hypothetical protein VG796_04990 [Verrucomicrobiales bacterium]|nr:hypothetical protein [Verrucomicrobiales bacterium]
MKISLTIHAVLAAGASAYFGFRPAGVPATPPEKPDALQEDMLAAKTKGDSEEVFKRALWRRPSSEDKILHAERREWTEGNGKGTAHWQWFLAIEPGAALKAWLREQNPFSVQPVASTSVPVIRSAPEWFPNDYSGCIVQTGGSQGNLVFLISRKGNTMYATGSGTGFMPGAAASPKKPGQAPQSVTQGRLPKTPPPATLTP